MTDLGQVPSKSNYLTGRFYPVISVHFWSTQANMYQVKAFSSLNDVHKDLEFLGSPSNLFVLPTPLRNRQFGKSFNYVIEGGKSFDLSNFYRTRVRSLFTLVTN